MKFIKIIIEIIFILFLLYSIIFMKSFLFAFPLLCGYLAYKIYSQRTNILAYKANIAFNKGDYTKALSLYETACNIYNVSDFIKLKYAYLSLYCGKLDECNRILNLIKYNQLSEIHKKSYKLTEGLYLWKTEGLETSIKVYKDIYENYKHTTVYETLGYLLILNKDYDVALDFNLEAYDYDKDSAIIVDNLAESYYFKNELSKAEELYNDLLNPKDVEKAPKFPEPYYYYGLILKSQGNTYKALEYFNKALEKKESFLSTLTHADIQKAIDEL